MVITFHGGTTVRVQQGEYSFVFNPQQTGSGGWRPSAPVILKNDSRVATRPATEVEDKSVVVIDGPGEYELQGIFIRGISNIFDVRFDNTRLIHLGNSLQNSNEFFKQANKELLGADIVMVNISSPEEAYRAAISIEGRIIVPIGFDDLNSPALKEFFNEAGVSEVEAIERLTIKKKDLEGKDGEVIVIKPI